MIKDPFQLKPVNNFGRTANISKVGKYCFLIQWTKNNIGAEFFRLRFYKCFNFYGREFYGRINNGKAILSFFNTLAEVFLRVEKIDVAGEYLRMITQGL